MPYNRLSVIEDMLETTLFGFILVNLITYLVAVLIVTDMPTTHKLIAHLLASTLYILHSKMCDDEFEDPPPEFCYYRRPITYSVRIKPKPNPDIKE